MKRILVLLLAGAALAAGGVAAATAAGGAGLARVSTDTTATGTTSTTDTTSTGTTGTTSPTDTTSTGARQKVVVCHPTGSKRHPAVTVAVAPKAVAAILKHGGHLGACSAAEMPAPKEQNQQPAQEQRGGPGRGHGKRR